jgi:hypothetical protein
MRTIALALAVGMLATTPASAINRYNSEKMSCSQVQATIKSEGAAIMRYHSKANPSLQLYDRYVRNGSYCNWNEAAVPAWIPSRDDGSCFVRKCREVDHFDDHPPFGPWIPH